MSRRRRNDSNDKLILWLILGGVGLFALLSIAGGVVMVRWLLRMPTDNEAFTKHAEPPPDLGWQPQPQMPLPQQPPVRSVVQGQFERADMTLRRPFAVDPVLERQASGASIYLSDMQEFGVTEGPMGWRFAKNGQLGNSYAPQNRIVVNGKNPPKGLSTHPPFSGMLRVAYALGGKGKSLHGTVALSEDEDRFGFGGPVRFVVMGDGVVLWGSDLIGRDPRQQKFDVNVAGVQLLELRAYAPSGSVTGAHAVWVDPYLAIK